MTTDQTDSAHRAQRALVLVSAFAIAWNLLGNLVLPSVSYVPANLAATALLVAVARWATLSWSDLGLARASLVRGVFVGLLAAVAVAAALAVGLLLPGLESVLEDEGVALDSTFDRWFVPLVRIPLGTTVFEEVLFRSVLFGLIVRLRDVRWAIVTTSLVFGLWHIVPAWESSSASAAGTVGLVAGTVVFTTVAGVLFALLRVWSKSVIAPILAHWATNSLSYAAALIALEVVE